MLSYAVIYHAFPNLLCSVRDHCSCSAVCYCCFYSIIYHNTFPNRLCSVFSNKWPLLCFNLLLINEFEFVVVVCFVNVSFYSSCCKIFILLAYNRSSLFYYFNAFQSIPIQYNASFLNSSLSITGCITFFISRIWMKQIVKKKRMRKKNVRLLN